MSTESDVQTPAAAATPSAVSPGAMIREGRERMRLSLDDLAGVTKLSYNTLEALERDDFSAMLEPVYVRGYYRKCAKVLELPEKALLQAYEARVVQKMPEPPAKLRLASGADLGSASRLPVALAISAAVIAVVVCAIVWVARSSVQAEPVAITAPSPVVSTATESEPAATGTDASTADTAAAATPAPSSAAAADPSATTPSDAAPPPATAAPVSPAATATADSAVLSFSSASWVRVDDANGRTLFNDMGQPGDNRVFNGALPLNVFLGNAPVVKVEFRGQAVDVQPFVRSNNTARFTLPPSN
jgi:cytoskeleton protein RodZ